LCELWREREKGRGLSVLNIRISHGLILFMNKNAEENIWLYERGEATGYRKRHEKLHNL
jgi:hypothetical protein